jgi:hypothetical protein
MLVPYEGKTLQAFGENLGRDFANQPALTSAKQLAAPVIGGLLGGPVGLAAGLGITGATNLFKMAELASLAKLGKTAALQPGFAQELKAAQGRAGIQGQIPQTPLLTNNPSSPGPVNPATMYVAPEGVAGTNINQVSQAGAQQKYAPQPVAQTPAQQSQQLAAQKLQEIQQAPKVLSPQQQAILDQIRARKNPPAPEGGTPVVNNPPPTTPPAGGGTGSMFESLPGQRWTPAEKLALERANLQNNPPPAMTAAQEAAAQKEISKQSNLTDWGKKTTADKDAARGVLQDWFDNGGTIGKGATDPIYGKLIDLDDKVALKEISTRLANQAKEIQKKAGVDAIPSIPGFRDEEVIRMAHDMLTTKKSPAYTPSQSTSSLQEALNKVKGSNEARTSKTINNELNNIDEQMTNLRDDALESRLKPNTPEGQAYSNQLGELNKQAIALQKELEIVKKAEKKTGKSAPKNVSQMLIDDSASNSPDLLFSKLGQDRYKQLGAWKNEYTGSNMAGNESQAIRTVMDKDGTVVKQVFDSEFGMARFEGKNNKGDNWVTEYDGNGTGGKNTKLNNFTAYSEDLSILNPNNITKQTVVYKDGRTFERSSLMDEPELTYWNPKTGNHITFDENGNVVESVKIGKIERTLSDGSKKMFDDYSNTTPMTPEIDKFPNLENVIDNFEFPTKTTQAPKNVSQMMIGEPKPTGALEQSIVAKRSFNGDLQKYRYGTEKAPLTLEEYNHLKNSEFIDKQNTRDIIMGMRPDLTEYSIWYKDKSGKIQNIQTYGNEFKKK